MLKLKLQHFGPLMRTANSLEEYLMLGKIEGRRRRGHQRMSKFINVGVGGIYEDEDMRKGTFKSPKRKQSFLDKELTPALRKELKENVEIFFKFY